MTQVKNSALRTVQIGITKINKMSAYESTLTDKNKKDILSLFYRTELYFGEKIVDNRDTTIANELGLKTTTVSNYISNHLDFKFTELNKKINNESKNSY